MTTPSQIYQKRVHDALHSAKVPDEILLGRFQYDDNGRNAVERPGWRSLTPDEFWQLVHRLATCTNVTRFEFSGNAVGPKAFAVLTQVLGLQRGLTHIDLRQCDIRDIGCKNLAIALEVHSVVRFLGLSHNRIRRTGAKMLARALKKCTSLQHIDMSCNVLGSRGLLCIQQPLRLQSNLRHVDFSNCGFDDVAFFWMCDALALSDSLRYISLSDNNLGPAEAEAFAKALKRQTSLECLILSGNVLGPKGCATIFSSFKRHTALQHVNLRGNLVLDKGLVAMCNCLCLHSRMQYLDLSGNGITSVGCPTLMLNLHHWPQLSHLDVGHNMIDRRSATNITETVSLHLLNLESINLSHNKIHSEGLLAISQALGTRSKLKVIDLRGNDVTFAVCLSVCENVKGLKNLEALFLDKDCELMPSCIASRPYINKFPPPPPELVACKAWVELVRFLQNPSAPWKATPGKEVAAVCLESDAVFDSDDVHGADDESDAESAHEGSSCEQSCIDESSSSSDDDDDFWEDAGSDDGSVDSDKGAQSGPDVGSKRKLSQAQPTASAVTVAAPAAPVLDAALTSDAQPLKRLSKSAIYDIVIQSDLLQLPVEFVKQMCCDSGLSSAGNKSNNIKRLQARYLNKYTKLFSE
jgi:Ran GTPase-activating protein (RanGAP) involved in mRNA processing and transport